MKIIIFYEHLVREWDAIQRIKKILENEKCVVKVYSILFESEKALIYSHLNKIDAIVVPWFVDENHEKRIYPFVKCNKAVKIINLHHEQIGCKATEIMLLPKTDYTKNGSFHFVWGNMFEELLKQYGVEEKLIEITGNIRNDFSKEPCVDAGCLLDKYNINKNKKVILFAENRGYYSNRINEGFKDILVKRGMSGELIDKRIEFDRESLDLFYAELNDLDIDFLEKYEVIYRPHPGVNPPKDLGDKVHVISDYSIYDWIWACDVFVTNGSTSIFEAEACGKPCIIYETKNEMDDFIIGGMENYVHIKRMDSVDDSIIEKALTNQIKKRVYTEFFGEIDGKACERVAKKIIEICKNHSADILLKDKNKLLSHPTYKNRLRNIIFELTTSIMTRTGLLYMIKFPRSSYAESRDIPFGKEANWIRK